MKVLLINPPNNKPAVPGPPTQILNEGGIYPHIGLMHLATIEMHRGKHDVKILDAIAEDLDEKGIIDRILEEKPQVLGVTLTTVYLGDGYSILRSIKKLTKDIITIVGGPHVSLYPKESIELPEIDIAIVGEAEFAFGYVLDAINEGRPLEQIEGVLTKNNLNTKVKKLIIDNLDAIPIVQRRLLKINKYYSILSKNNPVTIIMTSRGCPFRCAYCPQAGTRLRKRSADKVAEEIQQCIDMGIKDILFFDELFTLEHERVKELCNEFIKRKLKFRWHIRTRIKDVSKEIIDLLKKAGCRLIQFGIESGTERIQKIMNKNLDLKKVEEVVKMTRDAGILTYGNFMIGSPTESIEEMRQTIDFAIKIKLDFAVFAITALLPETEYYNMAFKQNKLKEDFWKKYVVNPLITIENAYWPDFDKNMLNYMCKKAYLKFYIRPWYIWNYFSRIASFQQVFIHFKSAMNIFYRFIIKKNRV